MPKLLLKFEYPQLPDIDVFDEPLEEVWDNVFLSNQFIHLHSLDKLDDREYNRKLPLLEDI